MSDSEVMDWSVVVGGEVSAGLAEPAVVEPQHRGQGEQTLRDADEDTSRCTPTVLFQPELAFEGVDDALDPLADAAQRPVPAWLVGTIRAQHDRAELADVAFEVATCESLVGVDAGPGQPWRRGVGEQGLGDLAL